MKQPRPMFLPVLGGVFVFLTLLCLYFAGRNLWSYLRMRTIPVEVVRSSLFIDAPMDASGQPSDIDYTLRLDLVTTDGSSRPIHWEDAPARAAYPEEAFDELSRWAPGARHQIFQLRGEARAIRLPGSSAGQELDSAIGFLFVGVFFAVFAIALIAVVAEASSWFSSPWLKRNVGVWLIFAGVGAGALIGDVLFIATQLPKIISWPVAVATSTPAPPDYESQLLPPNVLITASARQRLQLHSHRVLTFQWNGATLHAGLGANEGPYDALANSVCSSSDSLCRFKISPTNRWEIAPDAGWNASFFAPVGMFTLFGVAFGGAGLLIRRSAF